jgi:DNA-3-methyladenine glycosylase
LNGAPASPVGGLWIEDRGVRVTRDAIQATPRIGVDYAGPIWARKRWRFVLTKTVSHSLSERCK